MRRRWRARRVLSASVVMTWAAVQACGSRLVNPRETKPIHDALGACAYSLCQDKSRRAAFRTKDLRPAGFICPNLDSIGSQYQIVFNLDGLDSGQEQTVGTSAQVAWKQPFARPFGATC